TASIIGSFHGCEYGPHLRRRLLEQILRPRVARGAKRPDQTDPRPLILGLHLHRSLVLLRSGTRSAQLHEEVAEFTAYMRVLRSDARRLAQTPGRSLIIALAPVDPAQVEERVHIVRRIRK